MRLFPWDKSNKPLLGLAFDSASVKLLGLSQVQHQYRIETLSTAPVATDVIVDNDIKRPDALAQSIRLAHQCSGSRVKRVAVAMHSACVIYKYMTMNTAADTVFAHVLSEASQLIPYPLTEVALDYQIYTPHITDPLQYNTLLACSRQTHIDILDNIVRLAGLIPIIVDVETFAIARACERLLPLLGFDIEPLIAIVSISSSAVNFMVLQYHRILFSREETIFIQPIMHHTPSYTQDSNGLLKNESSNNHKIDESLLSFIRRSLQFFYANHPQQIIAHILLCGNTANIEDLVNKVQAATGIGAHIVDPLLGMAWAPHLTATHTNSHNSALTLACGLALRYYDDTMH